MAISRIAISIFSYFILSLSVTAQPGYQLAIGATGFDKGSAFKSLPDGGFIIAGETESFGLAERDMLLMKIDSMGRVIWVRSYGGPERETVNDVLPLPDNAFLFAAEKYQPNKTEGENLTLIKTDKNGLLQWKKIYDEGGHETEGFKLAATPDKHYIIAGMLKKSGMVSNTFFAMRSEEQSAYLLKIDANGNKVWSRSFNYGDDEVSATATSIVVTNDGSYVLSGNLAKKGKTDKKIEQPAQKVNLEDVRSLLVTKVLPNGNLQWAKEITGNKITMGYTIIETKDGGLALIGNTNTSASNIDIFLMKLDKNGSVIWSKTYGGAKFESAADLLQTNDGGFLVSGITYSFGQGMSDVLNFKTDAAGNVTWAKTYGGKNEEYPSKILASSTGIVTLGCTGSNGTNSFDLLLLKTAADGSGVCSAKTAKLTVSPFQTSSSNIMNGKMEKIEQGIYPPHMQKPDVKNISDNKREMTTTNLCD